MGLCLDRLFVHRTITKTMGTQGHRNGFHDKGAKCHSGAFKPKIFPNCLSVPIFYAPIDVNTKCTLCSPSWEATGFGTLVNIPYLFYRLTKRPGHLLATVPMDVGRNLLQTAVLGL